MSIEQTLELACPAKVNLALSIGAPRADGFHPIASWMVAVDFSDRLTLTRLASGASVFDLAFAADAPAPGRVDWPIEKDLAFRAHRLLEESAGRSLPVRLELRKRIPAGAGLGGGSSNAAATLVGLDRLFALNTPPDALRALAQRLGSDVAFLVGAMQGRPSAIVTGLGESLRTAPRLQSVHMALIFPGFGCPTGEVYKTFDRRLGAALHGKQADEARVIALAMAHQLNPGDPFNDLAAPAIDVRLELGAIQRRLAAELATPAHVTGSGSTLFVVAADAVAAARAAARATKVAGVAALATRTL